ncbi:MAG: neutral/alkaline non-lysosomal ceramidase N-terminal domain-containing protein [Clostridia bacterium]|nr:neutral/alkaline non-lysosomal ceramidase N-terminal domain-containing protein [Clostridia bacterium]
MKTKRSLAALLALLLLFATACGGGKITPAETEPATTAESADTAETKEAVLRDASGFCAGYGRGDITPAASVPLQGYGKVETRMSNRVLDKLYATCVAFSDGETKALIFSIDVSTISERIQKSTRAALSRQTGIPEDLISFTATHTHSGPAVNSASDEIENYYGTFFRGVLSAAKDALADLDRAELSWGTAKTDRLNFVRRYLLADGTYSQNNSGDYPSPIVAHETEADPEMRILYVKRTNGKDIVLVNWQAHPTFTGGESVTDISADIVGAFRSEAEKDLGVRFAFFQGAAGNLDAKSHIPGETRTTNYKEHGKLLCETLKEGLGHLTPVASGRIRSLRRVFTGTVNHAEETPERVAQAREVARALEKSFDDARRAAAKYNFANFYSATALLARMTMGATQDMELYAFAIGDFAFATSPFEPFDTNGMELRSASPFACTMNFGYSNGHFGYVPSAFGFEHRGYEGTTTRFVGGTGEQVVAVQLEMLQALKDNP